MIKNSNIYCASEIKRKHKEQLVGEGDLWQRIENDKKYER